MEWKQRGYAVRVLNLSQGEKKIHLMVWHWSIMIRFAFQKDLSGQRKNGNSLAQRQGDQVGGCAAEQG